MESSNKRVRATRPQREKIKAARPLLVKHHRTRQAQKAWVTKLLQARVLGTRHPVVSSQRSKKKRRRRKSPLRKEEKKEKRKLRKS